MHCLRSSRLLLLALLAFAAPAAAARAGNDALACAEAAASAARETGVPEDWLQAVALAESGRRRSGRRGAWPWTVNDHGEGLWFARKQDAVRYVERRLAAGRTSLDIGCFQINWRWHPDAFATLDAAFDPQANARYAARFLRRLYEDEGSWPAAVGRYHSATPRLRQAYRARVARLRAAVPAPPAALAAGGVALVLLRPAAPLLRAPQAPLIPSAAASTGGSRP